MHKHYSTVFMLTAALLLVFAALRIMRPEGPGENAGPDESEDGVIADHAGSPGTDFESSSMRDASPANTPIPSGQAERSTTKTSRDEPDLTVSGSGITQPVEIVDLNRDAPPTQTATESRSGREQPPDPSSSITDRVAYLSAIFEAASSSSETNTEAEADTDAAIEPVGEASVPVRRMVPGAVVIGRGQPGWENAEPLEQLTEDRPPPRRPMVLLPD
jgi:hypothetical protein